MPGATRPACAGAPGTRWVRRVRVVLVLLAVRLDDREGDEALGDDREEDEEDDDEAERRGRGGEAR